MKKVYFAHPRTHRVPGYTIAAELRRVGFEVFNPFDKGIQDEWAIDPTLKIAEKIWSMDFAALKRSDALFAWLPKPSIGTSMEIYAALTRPWPWIRVYIVTNIQHAFLMASQRCFPTIDDAINQMKEDFAHEG